jgi:diketogulonate reductase-like aldo/keto reductase
MMMMMINLQVILRWGIQRGTSVLPRSLHPDRIRSNFDILSWSLSEEDWAQINSMEPQIPLISNASPLLSLSGSLQAVEELEDNSSSVE